MKKYIDFPKKITNGFETIQFLNRLLDDKEKDMYYNLSNIAFFEASMVPFFHSLNMQLFQTHEKILYNKINKEIEEFFLRNKYASKFNSKYMNIKLEDIYKTYIEFVEIKKDDESGFYIIEKNLKDKKLMDFNDELQNFFISLVGELTNNSHEHGETEKAYFCGQYYPKISKLSFAISNLGKTINDDLYEELEELLIQSDIGMNMTMQLVEELESSVSRKKLKTSEQIYDELKELLKAKLIYNDEENTKLKLKDGKLNILLVVGVNGVGKTTSIGKIAKKLKDSGKKVIIGAGDTFRAAAIEQVEEWGKRTGVEVVKQAHGSDPAAVIFDTVKTAKNRGFDVAILDTAGRLHNKRDLMKELEKINKIIREQSGETDFETLLVIDSTTGQNGLEQARIFNEIVDLTGIILTKFDGTAKGGIIFPITSELKKPIKFIGVGEGIEDLREFDKKEFVEAMFD